MQLRMEIRTAQHELAARRFNTRLRQANAEVDFFLPEKITVDDGANFSLVTKRYYLVLEGEEVRASAYLQGQPVWVGGTVQPVWNVQSFLSEGIVNPSYAPVAVFMIKELLKRNCLIYAVGMGSESRPFPRLLKALRWDISAVPFFFRVRRASRFLHNLQFLRGHFLSSVLADLLAYTGVGPLLIHASQAIKRKRLRPGASYDQVARFDRGVDGVWEKAKSGLSFSIESTSETLNALLPATVERMFRIRVASEGLVIGWGILMISNYRLHHHFGDMRVGTIVSALSCPGKEASVVASALAVLAEHGVDLTITNEMQETWQKAFESCGFFRGPSNYLLGLSPALAAAIPIQRDRGRVHVNRADGDGICNL